MLMLNTMDQIAYAILLHQDVIACALEGSVLDPSDSGRRNFFGMGAHSQAKMIRVPILNFTDTLFPLRVSAMYDI